MPRWAVNMFAPTLSVAVVAVLMGLYWVGPSLLEPGWLGSALKSHEEWTKGAKIPAARAFKAADFLAGLRQLGPAPYLPDLSGAGLDIKLVSYVPGRGDRPPAIHAGFADTRNCRVSLWITQTDEKDNGLLVRHYSTQAFSWHTGGLRYVLMTRDMDIDRFHVIAKTSRNVTMARQSPTGVRRTALGISAMISPPCGT